MRLYRAIITTLMCIAGAYAAASEAMMPAQRAVAPSDTVRAMADHSLEKKEIVGKMASQYTHWTCVETSGKLKMSRLPVAATVKVWMLRGKSVKISLRAPFIGEVGRVEIARDSVLLVNKMKKCYCKESSANLLQIMPTAIDDIQNFLLGRMVIIGKGEFKEAMESEFDIYRRSENWMVVPGTETMPEQFGYGYLVGDNGLPLALMLESQLADGGITLVFEREDGLDIDFTLTLKDKEESGRLELNPYRNTNEAFASLKLTDKYRRVGLKQFLRSF